jgi:RNA polymerase sporulation-specific sigma factor
MIINDYEMIYYILQNNEYCFELLVQKYEKYIYYIINLYKKQYTYIGYEDSDLYNEALILLYECIFTYQDEYNVKFSSYYLSCLKRKLFFLLKRNISNKNKLNNYALSLDQPLKDDTNNNLYTIIDNQEKSVSETINDKYYIEESIKLLRKKMSEQELHIVHLYFQGYSYQDISGFLFIDTKKVDNTIQKYKKIVRQSK